MGAIFKTWYIFSILCR